MIEIDFTVSRSKSPVGLKLKGHAGLSEKGTDVLCAAVSVLSENLGESIEKLLAVKADISKSSGFYSVKIRESDAGSQTELLFSSVLLGLQVLQSQYPDRIHINFIKE